MESLELRIFREVAYEKSISKAAIKLGYVQSNVTAHIHSLEMELGTSLFIRNNKGAILTEDGKKLLPYADQIIHLLDSAKKQFQNSPITLKIGATQTIAAFRLPIWLAVLKRENPDILFSITTNQQSTLIEAVSRGELDCTFVNMENNHPDLESIFLFSEKLAVITGESTLQEGDSIYQTIVVTNTPGCPYRSLLENWILQKNGYKPKVIEFDTLEAILKAVSLGMGITLLPLSVIPKEPDYHISNTDETGVSNIRLVVRKDTKNPIMDQLTKIIQTSSFN